MLDLPRGFLRAESDWLEYPEDRELDEGPDPDEAYDRMRLGDDD